MERPMTKEEYRNFVYSEYDTLHGVYKNLPDRCYELINDRGIVISDTTNTTRLTGNLMILVTSSVLEQLDRNHLKYLLRMREGKWFSSLIIKPTNEIE